MKLLVYLFVTMLLFSCGNNNGGNEKNFNPEAIELYDQATGYILKSEWDSALLLFDKSIEADPSYHLPHSGKARVLGHKKEFDKALIEMETAITKNPDNAEAWQSAGVMADLLDDTVKATGYYRKSIELFYARIEKSENPDVVQGNNWGKAISLILLEDEIQSQIEKLSENDLDTMILNKLRKMDREAILNAIKTGNPL